MGVAGRSLGAPEEQHVYGCFARRHCKERIPRGQDKALQRHLVVTKRFFQFFLFVAKMGAHEAIKGNERSLQC